jgi:hypothetical protein
MKGMNQFPQLRLRRGRIGPVVDGRPPTLAPPHRSGGRGGSPLGLLRRLAQPLPLIGVALLLVGAVGYAAVAAATRTHGSEVVVAARYLPAGSKLTAADLRSVKLSAGSSLLAQLLPASEESLLLGRRLAAPALAGVPLGRASLAASGGGPAAFTLTVPALHAVGGNLAVGDRVSGDGRAAEPVACERARARKQRRQDRPAPRRKQYDRRDPNRLRSERGSDAMSDRPTVLLALSPLVEQDIAPLLFGDQPAVTVAASLVELAALERTLAATDTRPEALLVSADLPDLTPGLLSHARTHGLRLIGIATDDHDATLLRDLPLDTTLTTPLDPHALHTAIRPATLITNSDRAPEGRLPRKRTRERDGAVLAVLGGRGAPGASELACSLAALAGAQWPALLVELDLLGNAGLALRLGADPSQGSLLALLRATKSGEPALAQRLERWLITRAKWPPVLLAPAQPEHAIEELDQPGAIRSALDALAAHYALVVADVGFLLAHPGGLGPVERCHREAVLAADAVLLTLGARETQLDAGLAQLDLLLDTLAIPGERIRVVCNGVGGPGAIARTQLEQTLTIALRERELAADALIPWDTRALAKAGRTGLPLPSAHARGSYAHALTRLLNVLFLPGAPVARGRKRLLALPTRPAAPNEPIPTAEPDEEVALPWRN